jgi:hypothetical protein
LDATLEALNLLLAKQIQLPLIHSLRHGRRCFLLVAFYSAEY